MTCQWHVNIQHANPSDPGLAILWAAPRHRVLHNLYFSTAEPHNSLRILNVINPMQIKEENNDKELEYFISWEGHSSNDLHSF